MPVPSLRGALLSVASVTVEQGCAAVDGLGCALIGRLMAFLALIFLFGGC